MSYKSPLFGRRIHITGSVAKDAGIASLDSVLQARELVKELVCDLIAKGATFVIPIDNEKIHDDGRVICFDWLILETIANNLAYRPREAPNPLIVAVQHHKNEEQIPEKYQDLWGNLRVSDVVKIENANQWNMNSKRMEMQARWGDILITIGGSEGVCYLANLYHDAGKPVIPLNLPLCDRHEGSLRLFNFGLGSEKNARRLFRVSDDTDSSGWLNRINFPSRSGVKERVATIVKLLEALRRPQAFFVRLLDPNHADFNDVEFFFITVLQHVVENELGYQVTVIDGKQNFEYSGISQDIFERLYRSRAVFVDITGERPNCFIELGYSLGRSIPTVLTAREGTPHPFDIKDYAAFHWKKERNTEECRKEFLVHWNSIKNRPPIVLAEALIL